MTCLGDFKPGILLHRIFTLPLLFFTFQCFLTFGTHCNSGEFVTTAWVLQKFQAALDLTKKVAGVTGVTWLEQAKAVGASAGILHVLSKKNSNSVQHFQNSFQFFFEIEAGFSKYNCSVFNRFF